MSKPDILTPCDRLHGKAASAIGEMDAALRRATVEIARLRAALAEALNQWEHFEDSRNREYLRIAELRREHGL